MNMNKLLSHIHTMIFTTLMLGLLSLPTYAEQPDSLTLENRIQLVEGALPDIEKEAKKYSELEFEFSLHLAAILKKETQIQTGYTEFKNNKLFLAHIMGASHLDKTESLQKSTQMQTVELKSAFENWYSQRQQAKDSKDEICSNKDKRRDATLEQLSQQINSGTRQIEEHTAELRKKREVLDTRWNILSYSSRNLDIGLNDVRVFLSKEEEYLERLSNLLALINKLKRTCQEAQKDINKAAEVRKRLKSLSKFIFTYTGALTKEIHLMRTINTDLASSSEGRALIARLNSAQTRAESAVSVLAKSIPNVSVLDHHCKILVDMSGLSNITAKVEANFQRAETINEVASPVLEKAKTVLDETSSELVGFGGLGKARQCLNLLRNALIHASGNNENGDNEVLSLVEELQSQLETAERKEHIFAVRSCDNKALAKKVKQMVEEDQNIIKTLVLIQRELNEQLSNTSPDQIMQNLETLLSDFTKEFNKLKKAGDMLAEVIKEAKQQQQTICDRATRAGSTPSPSSTELQFWKQESESALNRIQKAIEDASRAIQVHTGFMKTQMHEVAGSQKKLKAVKDKLLIRIKALHNAITQTTKAKNLIRKAFKIWRKVEREGRAMEDKREVDLEELKKIQADADTLIPRLISTSATVAELKTIKAKAAELVGRYPQTSIMVELVKSVGVDLSIFSSIDTHVRTLRDLSSTLTSNEQKARKAMALIKKADTALEETESVLEATSQNRSSLSGILAEAENCINTLADAISSSNTNIVSSIRKALNECNYDQAQSLLNTLTNGETKRNLKQELNDARALKDKINDLIDKAKMLYEDCRFNKVDPILEQAFGMAECSKHKKYIEHLKERNNKRRERVKPIIALVKDAKKLYYDCEYDDALAKLRQAEERKTSCQRFTDGIAKRKANTEKAQKRDTQAKVLFGKGKEFYKEEKYKKALAQFKAAKKKMVCKRYKKFIQGWIERTESRIDSGEDENQSQGHAGVFSGGGAVTDNCRILRLRCATSLTGGSCDCLKLETECGQEIIPKQRKVWTKKCEEQGRNRSCSIIVHDDYHGPINGKPSPWGSLTRDSGNRRTYHIARRDGPWWRKNCRSAFCWMMPVCGTEGAGSLKEALRIGRPCTLSEMKAMARKECERWKLLE